MDITHFKNCIGRIQNNFKGEVGPEFQKELFKRYEGLDNEEFYNVCSQIIFNQRGLPIMKDFDKYGIPILQHKKLMELERAQADLAAGKVCPVCDGSGLTTAYKKNKPHAGPYGFACTARCDAWQLQQSSAPIFTAAHKDHFVVFSRTRHGIPHNAWCEANGQGDYAMDQSTYDHHKESVEKIIKAGQDFEEKQKASEPPQDNFAPPF